MMTEDNVDDGNYLVRIRAQVMKRDDSTGGWVPLEGGGLSNISVRKRPIHAEVEEYEYLIYGKRISDQSVVLKCAIKKDIQYNKATPAFHHWMTDDKKFGLTFQTPADARAFARGVRQAVEDLLGGLSESWPNDTDVGEDDVFMTLDLPVEKGGSQSSSGSSSNGGSCGIGCSSSMAPSTSTEPFSTSPYSHSHANNQHLHRIHYIPRPQRTSPVKQNGNSSSNGHNGSSVISVEQRSKDMEDIWVKNEEKQLSEKEKVEQGIKDSDRIEAQGEPYCYFQLPPEKQHEYSYPLVDEFKMDRRDTSGSSRKPNIESKPTILPTKTKKKKVRKKDRHKNLLPEHTQCKHCHEWFTEEDNERGNCEYAPDHVRSCIDRATCITCAQCMLYHCMSDAEGDFAHHPCSCDNSDEHCGKRWIGLTLLSFFVPCLCCFLPLKACHKCCISCGICGGRHEAGS